MKQADVSVGAKQGQASAKAGKADKAGKAGVKGSAPSGAKAATKVAAQAATLASAKKTAKPAAPTTKKTSQAVAPPRKASAAAKPRKTETKVKTTNAAPAKPDPKAKKSPAAKPATAKAPAKATAKAPAKAPAKAAPAKAPAAKAPAAKSTAAKAETAKPSGAKAQAAKPAAVQSAPAKPMEAKPAEAKQAEAKQAEAKQAEAKPAVAKPAVAKPVAKAAAPVAAPARAAAPVNPEIRKPVIPERPVRAPAKQETFVEGDHVVYPTHGVGKVERIAIEDIAGHRLELIHITFEENRMTLRVPVSKARSAGLRKLATRKLFDEAMTVLKGRARIKRTMWSRRAQEYEAKINSGDPLAVAEVVRDLHRNAGQPDQSFSERQIYEAAMDRLAAELAALDSTDKATAAEKLVEFLKTL